MTKTVLVLNANYEPINVTNTHRAISLIINDKATLILNGRGRVKSVSRTFDIPSVIRLNGMVKLPRLSVRLTRNEVFRRDHHTCQYCGERPKTLTIDHVIPKHMGGKHTWSNVVTACHRCNHIKGGRTPEEAHMHPKQIPAPPPASKRYMFGAHLEKNEAWLPFVDGW